MQAFASPHPWSSERPETLVVCCSDGRFHLHIEEFVRSRVSERADLFVVPGGPAVVDPWASSFDHARVFEEALRLFASAHEIRSIWLIAHQGCAFYVKKHGHLGAEELRRRQIEDLHRARERILKEWPHEVLLVFASVEGGRVKFQEVEARSEAHASSRPWPWTLS
jgi:carbonic anhydrase